VVLIKCTKCGQEINDNSKFCQYCGARLYSTKNNNEKWYQKKGWIIALLFLFFPAGLFLMWKSNKFNKTTKILVAIFFVFMFIITPASQEKQNINQANKTTVENKSKTNKKSTLNKVNNKNHKVNPTDMTIDEYTTYLVNNTIGKTTNMGNTTLIKHTYSKNDNELFLELYANENFSSNMTRRGIIMDSKDIFKKFFNDRKDVRSLVLGWYLTLVDQRGNEKLSRVLLIDMTKSNANTINWSNVITDNIPVIANHYWVHPALK